MNIWQAIVLGAVEGVTEFLPVSSTGHLTITEKMLGLKVDDPAVTAFTAVIQIGAIAAVLVCFARDLWRMICGFSLGLASAERRRSLDFRLALAVLLGSLPIGVVGLLGKDVIVGPLRNLWVVAVALIAWSAVMVFAERAATHRRGERSVTTADGIAMGLAQVLALVPGVSRSGATISAGLLRDIDRVTATRLSFYLGIPSLVGAGLFELEDALAGDAAGIAPLVAGSIVSFVVAYASINWLLRFVANHSLSWFAGYRVLLGSALLVCLSTGALPAT